MKLKNIFFNIRAQMEKKDAPQKTQIIQDKQACVFSVAKDGE